MEDIQIKKHSPTNRTSWKKLNRAERGQLINQTKKITKTGKGWRVPSQSYSGQAYTVRLIKEQPKCTCPDCEIRKEKCKHIHAVEYFLKEEISNEGKITRTKGVKITYAQQWPAYDKAQTSEKLVFVQLLKELCEGIEQPSYTFGRPTIPMPDMIFSIVMKVYTTFSLRRFMSDLIIAKRMGLIKHIPCYASVGHHLQKETITPILQQLIETSATPLASVEQDFAMDASGFSTSRFARYFDYKYNKETKYRTWLKAHLLSGVKTNIVIRAEITEGHANDSPQLAPLMKEVSKQFQLREVSCDRAYSSRKNLELIHDEGATPFIPFKSNVSGKSPKNATWKRMYHYFLYKHEEFLKHYHKRSNSETVFHMVKSKFKDNLRSKTKIAQINELLAKILCHNLSVLIQEIQELGIKAEFIIKGRK